MSDTSLLTDLHEALKEHQNTTDTALRQIKDKIESLALQTYCEALRECSDQNTSEIDKLSRLMKDIEVQSIAAHYTVIDFVFYSALFKRRYLLLI